MKKENLSSLARISKFGGWVYRFELILITLLLVGGFIAFFFVSIEENDVFEGFIILGYCILAAISLYFSYLIAGYFFLAANDKGYMMFFIWRFAFSFRLWAICWL